MPKELGVWTAEDCAPVLIDYQNEMLAKTANGVEPIDRSSMNAFEDEADRTLLGRFGQPEDVANVDGGMRVW